jgi:hypothetical protein
VGQLVLSLDGFHSPILRNVDTTFELARTSNANVSAVLPNGIVVASYLWQSWWSIYRTVLAFDYTVNKLPSGAIVSSIVANVKNASNGDVGINYSIDFVSGIGLVGANADFATLLSAATIFSSTDISLWIGDIDLTLNASGLTDILTQLTSNPNYLYLGVRVSNDILDIQADHHSAVSNSPTLTINYTSAPSPKLVGSNLNGAAYSVSRRLL